MKFITLSHLHQFPKHAAPLLSTPTSWSYLTLHLASKRIELHYFSFDPSTSKFKQELRTLENDFIQDSGTEGTWEVRRGKRLPDVAVELYRTSASNLADISSPLKRPDTIYFVPIGTKSQMCWEGTNSRGRFGFRMLGAQGNFEDEWKEGLARLDEAIKEKKRQEEAIIED